MNQQNLDFRVTRDIDGQKPRREIDRRRQRELWRSLAVGICFAAVLLLSAWQSFSRLRYGYEIEQLQREHAAALDLNQHLRLEIETLSAPARIERLATAELGLAPPAATGVEVIERRVAPPPDRALLADRDTGARNVRVAAR